MTTDSRAYEFRGPDYRRRERLLDRVVVRLVARVLEHFAMTHDAALRSITNTARLAMFFSPIMSGLTTPYFAITSLL